MSFARSVDAFVQNLGELSKGDGELNAASLLAIACALLLVALPCAILCIVASGMGPPGNDPIPFTPLPDAPAAPVRPWKPNAKDKRLVDERLVQLKAKRPATQAQKDLAYKAAVYPHRSWSESGYTGSLRPHDVSPQRRFAAGGKIQRPDYADDGSPHGE
eukprot:COSAG03_NODE_6281_length_1084_cov_2.073542_2_plen_159_part_01